jgi:hypothetical protein
MVSPTTNRHCGRVKYRKLGLHYQDQCNRSVQVTIPVPELWAHLGNQPLPIFVKITRLIYFVEIAGDVRKAHKARV